MQGKSEKPQLTEETQDESPRRDFIQKAGLLIAGGVVGGGIGQAIAMSGGPSKEPHISPVDYSTIKYRDKYWNRDAMARIQGDLDFGKQKFGWYKGTVRGVVPGEKHKKLFGFEGFSFARLQDNGDGTYNKLLKEVGYYIDQDTGEVMDTYYNPYIDEEVKVVHIANDPFNYVISAFYPKPPSYGGLNADKTHDVPLILPFQEVGNNKVLLQKNIDLFYPSALTPDKWPRESPGKMTQVSEMFSYVFDKEDLANPEITGLQFSGNWGRLTPWLPWMLMGQEAQGHIYYDCIQGCYDNMDMVSPQVMAYAKKHHPDYFEAPTKWYGPSLSSLEHYALDQKPQKLKTK